MEPSIDNIAKPVRNFEKVVIVMPAYRAAHTLEKTFHDIPPPLTKSVILVDDASDDETVKLAQSFGIRTIVHERNRGYGANQKTCYDAALELEPDIIVMLHPDYQYDPRLIPYFLGFIQMNVCDVMIGSRIRTREEAIKGGMPLYKYLSNRLLTLIENIILGQNLGDFHSGFRVYTREFLETIPYHRNSDDFVFDTEQLVQAVYFDFRIGDCPMPVRYFEDASSIDFHRSTKYGLKTLLTLLKYILQKLGWARFPIFERKK